MLMVMLGRFAALDDVRLAAHDRLNSDVALGWISANNHSRRQLRTSTFSLYPSRFVATSDSECNFADKAVLAPVKASFPL
jgi:hypothetical protein